MRRVSRLISWGTWGLLAGCAAGVIEDGDDLGVVGEPEVGVTSEALTLTPIDEKFASGFTGWTKTGSPTTAWTTTATIAQAATYPATGSGAPVARVGTCSGRCSIERTLDLTGATAATLYVSMSLTGSTSYDSAGVRLWNGSSWVTILSTTAASTTSRNWARRSYNLSSYLGKANLKIALFGYSLESGEYAQFDDVLVTVTKPDAPPPPPACNVSTSPCANNDACCPMACTSTTDNDCAGSGGIDCRNPATWPSGWAAFESSVLTLVNDKRAAGATCGTTAYPAVAALALNADLQEAARCHSLDMATNNFMSHTGSNGSSPGQRIQAAGYTATTWGENVAAGYTTAANVVNGWMGSTGHCQNIMNGSFKKLGVGYAYNQAAQYDHYWTQDFGAP
jgi:uncharacterized protein YkwD